MKHLLKTIRIIAYIIIIPLLLYNITMIIQSILYPNKTPSVLGLKTYIIASGSMEPTLKVGDIVLIKEISSTNLKENDIISFQKDNTIITHRIHKILKLDEKVKFQTKGDHNQSIDSDLVEESNIEGKMIIKIPYIGKILVFLVRKEVMAIVIVCYYSYLILKKRK